MYIKIYIPHAQKEVVCAHAKLFPPPFTLLPSIKVRGIIDIWGELMLLRGGETLRCFCFIIFYYHFSLPHTISPELIWAFLFHKFQFYPPPPRLLFIISLAWALFVSLSSTLVCCQPTELILGFFCFVNCPILLTSLLPPHPFVFVFLSSGFFLFLRWLLIFVIACFFLSFRLFGSWLVSLRQYSSSKCPSFYPPPPSWFGFVS